MPQFKIAKTATVTNLPSTYSEDTLYIVKNKKDYGELYYDYTNGVRIRLKDSKQIYQCTNEITLNDNGFAIITTNSLKLIELKIENDQVKKTTKSLDGIEPNINNVDIGQFVIAPNGIFIIEHITSSTISVIGFYIKEHLQWVEV